MESFKERIFFFLMLSCRYYSFAVSMKASVAVRPLVSQHSHNTIAHLTSTNGTHFPSSCCHLGWEKKDERRGKSLGGGNGERQKDKKSRKGEDKETRRTWERE